MTMFIQISPQKKIACSRDTSILEALQKSTFDIIPSICGGEGTCGKCKVKILSGRVSKPTGEEIHILSPDELKNGIRLACQTCPLESVSLTIEEKVNGAQYKTSLGMSHDIEVLDPKVSKIYLELPPPSLCDQKADAERLLAALASQGNPAGIAPHILPGLSQILRESNWKATAILTGDQVIAVERGDSRKDKYGIAFDLGTTTVAAYLLDLNTGEIMGQVALTNRQGSYGEDVMTRIDRAHNGDLAKLQAAAIDSMNELLEQLQQQTGVGRKNIYEAVVVGNTCMHHLLLGIDPYNAGIAPFTPTVHRAPDIPSMSLGLKIAPGGTVHLPPVISGFVGADTIGDVLALDFDQSLEPQLMIDIGTNAEMALTVDGHILACSAAAGPAFEGARISCGMRAAPGAIDRAVIDDDHLCCNTIDDKPAVGIAGSGLISVAAAMKRQGWLNRRGGVKQQAIPDKLRDPENRGIILAPPEQTRSGKPLILTWKDLGEELVIARAAIRTGIQVLLKEAGITLAELAGIRIAGAFGNFLDIADAMEIGLLPEIQRDRITGVGNAAGKGAIQILLSNTERQRAQKLPVKMKYVELSGYPDFNRMFSANMKM